VFIGHSENVSRILFTPDCRNLLSVGEALYLWDFLAYRPPSPNELVDSAYHYIHCSCLRCSLKIFVIYWGWSFWCLPFSLCYMYVNADVCYSLTQGKRLPWIWLPDWQHWQANQCNLQVTGVKVTERSQSKVRKRWQSEGVKESPWFPPEISTAGT